MRCTRRGFVQGSLLWGGSLLLPSAVWPAAPKKEEPWQPAYARLESQGKLAAKIDEAYSIFE